MTEGSRLRYVLMALAMGVGLACGPIGTVQPDDQGTEAPGESSTALPALPEGGSVLPLAPNPVSVEVTLEEGATADMEPYVRSAELQGDDGLRIELSTLGVQIALQASEGGALAPIVPPRTQITRIASLAGLPEGIEFVAGAQIEPSGWRAYYPAMFTLSLPPGTSEADLIGFSYEGEGDQFHLYPASISEAYSSDAGPTVYMYLHHFSGFGVLRASPEAAAAVGAPEPLSLQAEHALAQLNAQDLSGSPGRAILQDWYTQGVAARTAVAGNCTRSSGTTADFVSDSNGLLDAAIEFLEWRTAVEDAGQEGAFEKQTQDAAFALWESVNACLNSVCELCLELQDGEAASRMYALSNVHREVVGMMEPTPLDDTDWNMLAYACFANNGLTDQFMEYSGSTGGNAGDGGGDAPEIPDSCP
jgi:hypothetical protein